MTVKSTLTLAVACTLDDFQQFHTYWYELCLNLDDRIHLLILVQLGDRTGWDCPEPPRSNIEIALRDGLGLSRARNDCMDLCKTRWLWLMDADSTIDEKFLSPASLNEFFSELGQHHAVVFQRYSTAKSWQSAEQRFLTGKSLKRLTSLGTPYLIFDCDFANNNALRFSQLLGANSRFGWPRHGEEFAFSMGLALGGGIINRIDYSPVNTLRPSTGEKLGNLEIYLASVVIFFVIATQWMRNKLNL